MCVKEISHHLFRKRLQECLQVQIYCHTDM